MRRTAPSPWYAVRCVADGGPTRPVNGALQTSSPRAQTSSTRGRTAAGNRAYGPPLPRPASEPVPRVRVVTRSAGSRSGSPISTASADPSWVGDGHAVRDLGALAVADQHHLPAGRPDQPTCHPHPGRHVRAVGRCTGPGGEAHADDPGAQPLRHLARLPAGTVEAAGRLALAAEGEHQRAGTTATRKERPRTAEAREPSAPRARHTPPAGGRARRGEVSRRSFEARLKQLSSSTTEGLSSSWRSSSRSSWWSSWRSTSSRPAWRSSSPAPWRAARRAARPRVRS